jgi:hypothetical protein
MVGTKGDANVEDVLRRDSGGQNLCYSQDHPVVVEVAVVQMCMEGV